MALIDEARKLYESGLNVLPADRTKKRPLGAWKQWTQERPSFDSVFRLGLQFDAICVVCGKTSRGLEIIDFDQKACKFDEFKRMIGETIPFPVESTQSGGKHLAFRSNACGRNQKLATNASGVTIETRGEGGICLIAPSSGYTIESGDWLDVPLISSDERDRLLEAARSLSEIVRAPASTQTPHGASPTAQSADCGETAADYYRRKESGKDALRRHGWEYLRDDGKWEQWKRPGQPIADKPGASWSKEDGFFHVFSSNAAPFEPDRSYSHFQVVAMLDYGGDLSAAARAVSSGSKSRKNMIVEVVDPYDLETSETTSTEPLKTTDAIKGQRGVLFPQSLIHCGGLIEDIQAIMNSTAIRPQPEGAFLGALACVSFLCGRSLALNYNGTIVTPNIYALFLAPTGMGKEAIRRVGSEIVKAYSPNEPAPESFASVQALQNFVSRVRKVFWLHDEFGRDLKVMNGEKANTNVQSVITESLKLYSNAGNRSYLPKLISQEAKKARSVDPVDRPFLTIFATGNPSEYFDATSETLLENGYVARFTTVLGRNYSEKKELSFEEATSAEPFRLSPRMLGIVEAWKNLEERTEEEPAIVAFTRDAFDTIKDFDVEIERQIKIESATHEASAGTRARFFEKLWKYSLLFAASRYGATTEIVVDRDCARLATTLVDYESQVFSSIANKFATNESTRFSIDVIEWAKTIGGIFTKSEFTRKFQRRGTRRERQEVLDTLIDAEYLGFNDTVRRFYVK